MAKIEPYVTRFKELSDFKEIPGYKITTESIHGIISFNTLRVCYINKRTKEKIYAADASPLFETGYRILPGYIDLISKMGA